MSKVNCVQADWQQDVSAIAGLNAGGGAADSIATLIQDSFDIITDAEDTISRLDVDGEITSVFDTASVGKYQVGSFPALTEILHKYSKNAPSAIRNDIDLPFNMKLDSFLGAMSNVDIKSYSTAATGSLAKSGNFTTGNAGVVTLKDLLEPSTSLGKQLKREYIEFKNQIGDDFTYDDYQMMVMNLASYNYDSFLEALAKGSAAFALTVAVTSIPVIGPIISFGMSGLGALEGIWGASTGNSLLTGKKLTSEEKVLSGIFGAMNLAFAGLTAYNSFLKGKVKLPSKKLNGTGNANKGYVSGDDWENYFNLKYGTENVNRTSKTMISSSERAKLDSWGWPPSDELYLQYKNVYNNDLYFNQVTGAPRYPVNDGFSSNWPDINKLNKGDFIDRFGSNGTGQYFSPAGSSYGSRALPPFMKDQPYNRYQVIRPFEVTSGEIAPWFGEPGKGVQHYTNFKVPDLKGNMVEANVDNLIKNGYMIPSK